MTFENSLYKVEPTPFNKEILLPTSKSHANRALIIGAIRGNGFQVHNLPESTDVTTLLKCLEMVGLNISHAGNTLTFHNSFPLCEKQLKEEVVDLKTGDGGTTNRFLLALLSLGKKTYRLFPSEKMSERPIDDLILPLQKLKVEITPNTGGAWLSLKGPADIKKSSLVEIDCQKSTQFASAMMLAFSPYDVAFDLKNIQASESYLLMTQFILKETKTESSYTVPVDFSCLGYPLALALIKGRVLIKNCRKLDSLQADAQLIKLMQECGADIQWTSEGLLATSRNKLLPFDIDGSQFPDLVPTLAFLASHIEGKSTLRNLSVLRHKESDRLEEIIALLKMFSVSFQYEESQAELTIQGKVVIHRPVDLSPARDHRMVMTSYLFQRANQGGMLSETDCVEKSFPHFFEIME